MTMDKMTDEVRKHELKTDSVVFQSVLDGAKTYEIRFNDRKYAVGDILVLRETQFSGEEMKNGNPLIYTQRTIIKTVSHVLCGPMYGLSDGWAILSFAESESRKGMFTAAEVIVLHYDIMGKSPAEAMEYLKQYLTERKGR